MEKCYMCSKESVTKLCNGCFIEFIEKVRDLEGRLITIEKKLDIK